MKNAVKKLTCCLLVMLFLIGFLPPVKATAQTEQETVLCADFSEAALVLRQKLMQRQAVISLCVPAEAGDVQTAAEVMNQALVHTGVPDQGDYLHWSIRKCLADAQLQSEEQSMLSLTYTVTYYTTAEQEAELDLAVQALLEQMDVYQATELVKVKTIYDYICQNVRYDSLGAMTDDKLVYTAYGALISHKAVCQGYASLFYRLALELGVDARLIPGVAKNRNHGWNIVRLDGKYYNLDATWDADLAQRNRPYEYFLLSETDFENHTRKAAYEEEPFVSTYPMADSSYTCPIGDMNEDGLVNEDDAIYLLQYVLMPELFPINQSADYITDGAITMQDAIYLLQHVLLPMQFPLQGEVSN